MSEGVPTFSSCAATSAGVDFDDRVWKEPQKSPFEASVGAPAAPDAVDDDEPPPHAASAPARSRLPAAIVVFKCMGASLLGGAVIDHCARSPGGKHIDGARPERRVRGRQHIAEQ